ncbi:hypothetical protein RsTz2092_04730 [Deferribacterales bacterium RsTz2092]|nr:hypothetical protein AGMMS49941_02640 [Deferribacterales bacterium]
MDNNYNQRTKYYSIGDVARDFNLPPSTIRHWESKFPELDTAKTSGGHRRYTSEQRELIKQIKQMLYNEGYTIEGAQRQLANVAQSTTTDIDKEAIKNELKEILGLIEKLN